MSPFEITRHQYAQDNILQSYDLFIPEVDSSNKVEPNRPKYWILYIHGGYFRDPKTNSSSFNTTLHQLVQENKYANVRPHIAGYASINYRLSAHPAYPQDESRVPNYELRNARWPEHIHDVLSAIAHLQSRYNFGNQYLLVGHSVGATMAVLSILLSHQTVNNHIFPQIHPPTAILGVCGIYDFPHLHTTFPDYESLTRNAIPNPADDTIASPALYSADEFETRWTIESNTKTKPKRHLILAHSRTDGLVDWSQVERMNSVFTSSAKPPSSSSTATTSSSSSPPSSHESQINVRIVEISGAHDEIWERGTELTRVIVEGINLVTT